MNLPTPITSVETLPTELLEWLGERKIKPGEGDLWVYLAPFFSRASFACERLRFLRRTVTDVQLSHSMHWAAMQGSLETLDFLLAQGASPDAHNSDAASGLVAYPLHWAAINGRLMFCKVLLDSGAQVDSRGGELNATPMMWAAKLSSVCSLLKPEMDTCISSTYYCNMAETLYLRMRKASTYYIWLPIRPI